MINSGVCRCSPTWLPIFIGTDNKANQLVAIDSGKAARMRHCLRRYGVLQQRVARGHVIVGHVPDPQNPADYLTKFVGKAKVELSNEYATNSRNAAPPKRQGE